MKVFIIVLKPTHFSNEPKLIKDIRKERKVDYKTDKLNFFTTVRITR